MQKIIEALNNAYEECGYVQKKKSKNGGVNYTFAGEAALIKSLRPALHKHGIVVFPSNVSDLRVESYTTKNGANMNRVVSQYEFTFAHTSGESITVAAVGEGADTGDKAAAKAATIAFKYALRQTMMIETGDDPDEEKVDCQPAPPPVDKQTKLVQWSQAQAKKIPEMAPDDFEEWYAKQDMTRLKKECEEAFTTIQQAIAKRV